MRTSRLTDDAAVGAAPAVAWGSQGAVQPGARAARAGAGRSERSVIGVDVDAVANARTGRIVRSTLGKPHGCGFDLAWSGTRRRVRRGRRRHRSQCCGKRSTLRWTASCSRVRQPRCRATCRADGACRGCRERARRLARPLLRAPPDRDIFAKSQAAGKASVAAGSHWRPAWRACLASAGGGCLCCAILDAGFGAAADGVITNEDILRLTKAGGGALTCLLLGAWDRGRRVVRGHGVAYGCAIARLMTAGRSALCESRQALSCTGMPPKRREALCRIPRFANS